jgi:NTE family protein
MCLSLVLASCRAGPEHFDGPDAPAFANPGVRPGVALVLGSGGPRGFAHIGVLAALEEAGIRPDLVVGSSVGALVGALYAGGLRASDLEQLSRDLNVLEFFEFRLLTGGLATGRAVQEFVNRRVDSKPMERLGLAFAAVAASLEDRRAVIFNRGDTGVAVRASSASPGQFEPVFIAGEAFVDGDEASPVPIRAARRLGARVVIAVDISAYASTTPPGVPESWVEKDRRRASQVAQEAPGADVLLHPDIGYFAGHDEAYRRRIIDIAARYTRERIPDIRAAIAKGGQPSSTAWMPPGSASR